MSSYSRVEAIELTFTPLNSARRRLRFEPWSDDVGTHTLEEDIRSSKIEQAEAEGDRKNREITASAEPAQ